MSPVLQTLAELIRINSINPAYDNGRPEGDIAAWIADFFAARGIETRWQEVMPGRLTGAKPPPFVSYPTKREKCDRSLPVG